ncbi:MAG: T9SS type A sorting domain-containing protein [Bacteroidales bacterium]|nr:T9SS type A sorting domain-containing protein [Bacteroidales bacterium]
MKATIIKRISILFLFTTGFGLTSFAQCVSEENVYSFIYNGKNYEVIKETMTWAEAASCAVERGGYLTEIDSQAEQDTIYGAIIHGAEVSADYTTVVDGGGIAYIWIGASDQDTEGTWLWDGDGDSIGINFWNGQGAAGLNNGTPVDELYNNWGGSSSGSPNEPDDFNEGQDCAAIGLAKWPAEAPFTLGIASEWNDISSTNSLYYIIEFDCKETSSTITESSCNSYISPSGKTWTSSDTYLDTILNAAGCDSVITINLTIITIDTTVNLDGITLTANASGVEYQWLDCDQAYSIIEGESNQSFTASFNGNYAVEITEGSCVDTSACYAATPVMVNEQPFEDEIIVHQGTNRDIFHIDLGDIHQEIFIKIADINGRVVASKTFTQSQLLNIEIDTPPGIYFLTVTSEKQQAVIKIIKN